MQDKDPFFNELFNRIYGKDNINKIMLNNFIKKYNLINLPLNTNLCCSSYIRLFSDTSKLYIHNGIAPEKRLYFYIKAYIIHTFFQDSKIRCFSLDCPLDIYYSEEKFLIKKLFPSLVESYWSLEHIIEIISKQITRNTFTISYHNPDISLSLMKDGLQLIYYIYNDYADKKYLFR